MKGRGNLFNGDFAWNSRKRREENGGKKLLHNISISSGPSKL